MRILGLDHVSVTTGDIARSLAFYRDLLGLSVRSVGELSGDEVERITGVPGARLLSADLDLGRGQVLELLEYVGAPDGAALAMDRPGSGHIGLAVDDVDAIHHQLVDAGWTVTSEPVELTEPGDWFGARCMTVLDPDGVAVELVERPRYPRVVNASLDQVEPLDI
jgi:glyoxylase I family protein